MPKRETVRPGVVYGPVRPSGRRDRGTILGSLLGLLVIVVTIGLLGAGAYIFLEAQRTPAPTSSQSPPPSSDTSAAGAGASPSAVVSLAPPAFGALPTAPEVSATPSYPPALTPLPTIFVPEVQIGPGYVTFGSNSNRNLEITDPRTTFAIDEPIVWSAELTEPANTAELSIHILKLDPSAPDGQRLVRTDPVKPVLESAHIFLRKIKPIGATEGAGLYTVQYVRGDEIMSAGSFLVLEGS